MSENPPKPDIVQFVSQFVSKRFSETGHGTNGSQLATVIREQCPFTWQDQGYARLADVIREAERRGLLVRDTRVSHLEVRPPEGGTGGTAPAAQPDPVPSPVHPSEFVRPDVWRAAISVAGRYVTFVDRSSGQLLALPIEDSTSIQERASDPALARLDPIDSEQQRLWARRFVAGQKELDASKAPLDSPMWWRSFGTWLEGVGPHVLRAWNQYRSSQVIATLREWCVSNGVSFQRLIQPSPASTLVSPTAKELRHSPMLLRRAILASLAEMPLEQLENIPIPARLLLRHLGS